MEDVLKNVTDKLIKNLPQRPVGHFAIKQTGEGNVEFSVSGTEPAVIAKLFVGFKKHLEKEKVV